ncbi:ABC transporter ATP-binding protein [bacterium]|nr:ABC transporter ATP-binding protein [bacterium]
MKYIRWIWGFWRPHRPWIFVLALLTLLSSAVAIGYPLVFKHLLDVLNEALGKANPDISDTTTWRLVWLIAVIGLARSLTNLYPGTRAMLNARLEMDIRLHYFSQIIDKGHRFFQRFRTGDLVTRLTDDIGGWPKIAWFCCSAIFRAVESSSKFIFCMLVMFLMNWQLALLSIIPLPVMLYLFYRIRTVLGKRAAQRQKIISRTNEALEAAFSGVRILKAFCGEAKQAQNFRRILDERIEVELGVTRLSFGMHNIFWAIQFVGQIIVISAGGMMVIRGTLTIGEFYAFYIYLSLLLQPLMDLPNLFVTSRQAFASIDREIEIEMTPGGTEGVYTGAVALKSIDTIELRGVGFSYEDGLPPALEGISLSIRRGERVAVVGAVGGGKSTLVKVAAGLLPPSSGGILVNGRPLAEYSISDYRALVGYIPQEANLFSESVLENVRFGRDIGKDDILDSLALAQVKEEMEALPRGLDQVLGQKGLTVSGGQKQRLAIARALAGSPHLLLMDDCTASLDAENERAFWHDFARRFPDAACLIVTHRLATARQAGAICVLANGRIVGRGTHLELLESCKEYQDMLSREELRAAIAAARTT